MLRHIALPALGALLLQARSSMADEQPAHFEVSRSAEALTCPDAPRLAAAVAQAVGRTALDTSDAPYYGRFAVLFARLETGFVATIQREEPRPVARTLAESRGSCSELAGGVVVALALMLDQLGAEPESSPALLSPPAPAGPPALPPIGIRHAPPPPPEVQWEPRRHWYGWQTLAFDAASTAMVFSSQSPSLGYNSSTALAAAGLITFALAPPFVHGVHRRWGMFGADIGLRVGAVAMLAFVGGVATTNGPATPLCTSSASCTTSSPPQAGLSPTEGAFIGGAVGAAIASSIDSAVFARERVRAQPDADASPSLVSSLRPAVSPVSHGMTAGVGGVF